MLHGSTAIVAIPFLSSSLGKRPVARSYTGIVLTMIKTSKSQRTADAPAVTHIPRSKSASGLASWLPRWTKQSPSKQMKGNGDCNAIWVDKRCLRAQSLTRRRKPRLGDFFHSEEVKSESSSATCSTSCSLHRSSTGSTPAMSEDETYELSPAARVTARPRKPGAGDSCCMPFLKL